MKNKAVSADEFYDPTDDLDESEVIYEGVERGEEWPRECYDLGEFLAPKETMEELKKKHADPLMSVGVIVAVIAFCAFMFWLLL